MGVAEGASILPANVAYLQPPCAPRQTIREEALPADAERRCAWTVTPTYCRRRTTTASVPPPCGQNCEGHVYICWVSPIYSASVSIASALASGEGHCICQSRSRTCRGRGLGAGVCVGWDALRPFCQGVLSHLVRTLYRTILLTVLQIATTCFGQRAIFGVELRHCSTLL